jgi:hypothetical protein
LTQTRSLKKLRLVVEGGRPGKPWEGVQELSEADIRLLSLIQHESLQWITELSQVKGIEELDVVSDVSVTFLLQRIPDFHVLECSRMQHFRIRSRTNVTIR